MIRWLLTIASIALVAGCATSTHYHDDPAGADYYYGDDSGYYGDSGSGYYERDVVYTGIGYAGPGYCGVYTCAGWGLQSWPYTAWNGWGYPWPGYYSNPWTVSLWMGFGTYGAWGYPGYYNPWFGPWWWPWAGVYQPPQDRNRRDLQRMHRDRGLQASWHRYPDRSATTDANDTEPRYASGLNPVRQPTPHAAPQRDVEGGSMPRGRPQHDAGIPVNWPVRRSAPPIRHSATSPPAGTEPRSRPSPRYESLPQRDPAPREQAPPRHAASPQRTTSPRHESPRREVIIPRHHTPSVSRPNPSEHRAPPVRQRPVSHTTPVRHHAPPPRPAPAPVIHRTQRVTPAPRAAPVVAPRHTRSSIQPHATPRARADDDED